MEDDRKTIRLHAIEMHKKFTLSFACIIFFFIGAPLGAIIRKGGLGTPLVLSVFLFIIYYIIDNSGYKMARNDKLAVWQGIWLSSAVLFPLGLFFTYKAVNDSAVFNMDAYKNFFARITGRRKRELELKEIIMETVEPEVAISMIKSFDSELAEISGKSSKIRLVNFIKGLTSYRRRQKELEQQLNRIVEYLANTTTHRIIACINQYPYDVSLSKIETIRKVNSSLISLLVDQAPQSTGDRQESEH